MFLVRPSTTCCSSKRVYLVVSTPLIEVSNNTEAGGKKVKTPIIMSGEKSFDSQNDGQRNKNKNIIEFFGFLVTQHPLALVALFSFSISIIYRRKLSFFCPLYTISQNHIIKSKTVSVAQAALKKQHCLHETLIGQFRLKAPTYMPILFKT